MKPLVGFILIINLLGAIAALGSHNYRWAMICGVCITACALLLIRFKDEN